MGSFGGSIKIVPVETVPESLVDPCFSLSYKGSLAAGGYHSQRD